MTLPFGKAALLAGPAALLTPLVLAPLPAIAQDARDLDGARSDVLIFQGTVQGDPVVYRYTVAPNTTLTVDVIPADGSGLDPTLKITDASTGEVLAEDDDGGEGLASRARIRSEAAMQVEITVSAFAFYSGEESGGAFELHLRPTAYVAPQTSSIAYGSRTSGTLAADQSNLYTIHGEAGQVLEVALLAGDEELDPYLNLYAGGDNYGDPIANDDDGGEGLNSHLRFILPESGTYTIEAMGYGGSAGAYTLRVNDMQAHAVQFPEQVIDLGETASGYVGDPYAELSADPQTITYQLTPEALAAVRAGAGEVTFNMMADAGGDEDFPSSIDPFLELGFDTPAGFASLQADDDGGEGLNSRIAINLSSLAADGDWLERLRIRATSIGSGGAYRIEMVEGMQEVEDPYAYEEAGD